MRGWDKWHQTCRRCIDDRTLEESRDAACEEQDKEARRNNIILYRVTKSEAPLVAQTVNAELQIKDLASSCCLH